MPKTKLDSKHANCYIPSLVFFPRTQLVASINEKAAVKSKQTNESKAKQNKTKKEKQHTEQTITDSFDLHK